MNNIPLEDNQRPLLKPAIKNAEKVDMADILSIQLSKIIVPEAETETQVQETGFLVYSLSAEELNNLIGNKKSYFVKVAKLGEKVVGYLISYDLKEWEATHADWLSRLDVSDDDKMLLSSAKVLYGRHIVLDEHQAAAGTGHELLDATLQEAVGHNYKYFVVEILKEPISNNRSVRFVRNEGFRLIGRQHDEKNRVWSVFLKDLKQNARLAGIGTL